MGHHVRQVWGIILRQIELAEAARRRRRRAEIVVGNNNLAIQFIGQQISVPDHF
jgi:hypothetical protein